VRGADGGRVSIAEVVCYRPGDRPRLFYQLLVCRRRKGEPKGFAWQDYRDLIIVTHRQLAAPLVWCWDNLNIHLTPELAEFATENKEWPYTAAQQHRIEDHGSQAFSQVKGANLRFC
jgi:hypothetical protein